MGMYQMAYPLFCVLLTFSSAGIPTALARMIARDTARGAESASAMRVAFRLFSALGLAGTAIMCLLASSMARLQGNGGLFFCYVALAPSVFFVALIAVLRGYFQGKRDMIPTALSEVAEQAIKAGFGLFFAYRFRFSPEKAVAYALFAVTLSELGALFFLLIRYRAEFRPVRLETKRTSGAEILSCVFPVMAATSLLPFSQTVDSVLIVKLLSRFTPQAVSLYGLYAGGAVSLVNLPVSAVYGLAAASVPAVAASFATGNEEEGRRRAVYALGVTVVLTGLAAAGLFFLAERCVQILYPSLSAGETETLIALIRISSVSAVALAGTDTLAACLAGMGRAKKAAQAMLTAVLVKLALQPLLIVPSLSITGAAIAANGCYSVAFFLDLIYTVRKDKRRSKHDHIGGARRRTGRSRRCGNESAAAGG